MSIAPTRMNFPSRGRPPGTPQTTAARPQTLNAVAAQILASLPLPSGAPPTPGRLTLTGLFAPGTMPPAAAPGETPRDVMRAYLAAAGTSEVEALMEPDDTFRRTARETAADETVRPAPFARPVADNASPDMRPTPLVLPLTINRPALPASEIEEENRQAGANRSSRGDSAGGAQQQGPRQAPFGRGAAAAGLLLGTTVLVLLMLLLS